MTLWLYFGRRFFYQFLGVFGAFFALAMLTDATAIYGKYNTVDLSIFETLRLALYKAPSGVYGLMSIIVVLTSLTLFLGLSRNSELVATRAAGQSALKTLAAPVTFAFAIGVFGVSVFNPISATLLREYESESGRYETGTISTFSLSRRGLWLRQGNDRGQTVIFAERANFNATRLSGVTFFKFDKAGIITSRIETAFAVLSHGYWELGPGKEWNVGERDAVPDKTAVDFDTLTLKSDLTSGQILDSFGDPTTISIWEMRSFIDRLKLSGFATNRHEVYFQIELASPVLLSAMVMLGGILSMRHARSGGTGKVVLLTVLMGLAIYILQDFAEILGANGAIPVKAAAWGPPISALLVALGLVLHYEDG